MFMFLYFLHNHSKDCVKTLNVYPDLSHIDIVIKT